MNRSITIGVDLGGTRIKALALTDRGEIAHTLYRPTQDGNDKAWKQSVADAITELDDKTGKVCACIGISAPGLPDESHTQIAYMPGRLEGLENFNWSRWLDKKTMVINDAVAALMAEIEFGVARGKKQVVMLTLGTGVGGAILIDGKPYLGQFNKAGHIGHMVINDEGQPDVTGMPGSLETCIGDCTVSNRSEGRFSSTQELLHAYRSGDREAERTWIRSVRQLAIGLASITNILSPELIVLGGGITEAGKDLFGPLDEFMEKYEWRAGGNKTRIARAAAGDLSGALGAAAYAKANMK